MSFFSHFSFCGKKVTFDNDYSTQYSEREISQIYISTEEAFRGFMQIYYLQQQNNWPHFAKQNEIMRIRVDKSPQNVKTKKAVKKSDGQ